MTKRQRRERWLYGSLTFYAISLFALLVWTIARIGA